MGALPRRPIGCAQSQPGRPGLHAPQPRDVFLLGPLVVLFQRPDPVGLAVGDRHPPGTGRDSMWGGLGGCGVIVTSPQT